MTKEEFKKFCKEEFCDRGFKKVKKMFYLDGKKDLICGIYYEKSNYGPVYYVRVVFFIKDLHKGVQYPTSYESDITRNLLVMTKKTKYNGECYLSQQIKYEEYDKEELSKYFKKSFDEWLDKQS